MKFEEDFVQTWAIVDTDNYGGDYPDERFVAFGIRSEKEADRMAEALNRNLGEHSPRYYMVRAKPYKLQPGFEP